MNNLNYGGWSNDTMQAKVETLPKWAQIYIGNLLDAIRDVQPERRIHLVRIAHLEKQLRKQNDKHNAMLHMFECAAKGENEVATAVMRIANEWLVPDESEKIPENSSEKPSETG